MTEKEIIQKIYEAIKFVDCMQYNPLVDFNYLRAKGAYDIIRNQVEHIEAENAELRARIEKAVANLIKQNKELQHRAEVAERALREFAVQVGCRSCPYKGRCDISNPSAENDYQECYEVALRIAERELAEGKKE